MHLLHLQVSRPGQPPLMYQVIRPQEVWAVLRGELSPEEVQVKEATMSMPPVHPFAPFPDDPSEGWTEEQIRILSGQLIKR